VFFFFQAEDGIRDFHVTGVQTCALPISRVSGDSSTETSALSSQSSRNGLIGRSWLSARASIVPLMPPAEAPAIMSTTTRSSVLRSEERRVGEEYGSGLGVGVEQKEDKAE